MNLDVLGGVPLHPVRTMFINSQKSMKIFYLDLIPSPNPQGGDFIHSSDIQGDNRRKAQSQNRYYQTKSGRNPPSPLFIRMMH